VDESRKKALQRISDSRNDQVIGQVQTKTVGPPKASTGLVGDQDPGLGLKSTDFDTIANQVTLESVNQQTLDTLNRIGMATGARSYSGPIPETSKNVVVTDTTGSGSPISILFRPDPGQVWQFIAGQTSSTFNASAAALLLVDETTSVKLARETAANTDFEPVSSPIYITYDNYLAVQYSSASGNCTSRAAVIRVR
jgi:hypothetical protein